VFARPAWSGHLKLSLVTCPVALYKATDEAKKGVRFHLINPQTNNRVRMKPVDESMVSSPAAATALAAAPTAGRGSRRDLPTSAPAATPELQRSELVKGYEVDKGVYVTVTEEEIRALRVESNGAIQIERFVAEAEIDRLYWDAPYYLVPDGTLAMEPYAVIREAMREAGQVALARVVMNGRERQFALEVRGKGIVAHAIRTQQEVRSSAELFDRIPDTQPDGGMVTIAKQILQQHAGPFDPAAFVDRYQTAVLELVERKKAEQGIVQQGQGGSEPREAEIIDLMAALKASLAGGGAKYAEAKPRRKAAPPPAARAPANSAGRSRRSA
jgi:DNA end-binding protein Ku